MALSLTDDRVKILLAERVPPLEACRQRQAVALMCDVGRHPDESGQLPEST